MVVFDTNILLLVFDPNVKVPAVPLARERVEHLLKSLSESKTRVLVPAPVLAEMLVKAGGAVQEYLEILRKSTNIRVVPFDYRAAVECAEMIKSGLDQRQKTRGHFDPKEKIKFDQQIVAISKTEGATCIYSADDRLRSAAQREGIPACALEDIPIPNEARQTDLGLGDRENSGE